MLGRRLTALLQFGAHLLFCFCVYLVPKHGNRTGNTADGGQPDIGQKHDVTAPKYANLDKVNPGSVILSGEMMFRYMGWNEAADLIIAGLEGAIKDKVVTYDLARLIAGSKEVKCSEFADEIIRQIKK